MGVLEQLVSDLQAGAIEVVDLTARLHQGTPIVELPEQFGQTERFQLQEISRYDDRGPAWYWNNFTTGEHTGTHFDAPIHWVTGKDKDDVSMVLPPRLIGPAAVIDRSREAAEDPDYLLEVADIRAWEAEHGPLPDQGWVLYRTGWDARSNDPEAYANADVGAPGQERGHSETLHEGTGSRRGRPPLRCGRS